MKFPFYTVLATILLFSCNNISKKDNNNEEAYIQNPVQTNSINGLERAYFASGCFWCVEAIFESVRGVDEVISGYSGGSEKNPTYNQVSYGRTSHAEAVEVYYDPETISFETLVEIFFGSHDPTTLNRQGPDKGKQYRSIAFYQNERERKIIESVIKRLNESTFDGDIVTEVVPFQKFWKAEEYHQNYERKHPENPYIQNVSIPRLKRFKSKFPHLLKPEAH